MTARLDTPPRTERDRTGGFVVIAAMAIVMWAVEVVDIVAGDLDSAGIQPRDPDGLPGIVASPFLHASFGHLIGNTIPFIVLGAAIAVGGLKRTLPVTAIVVVVGGVGTWLTAPSNTVVIGASGLVFGYATYLVARGVVQPHAAALRRWPGGAGDLRLDAARGARADARHLVAGAPLRRDRRRRRGARRAPLARQVRRAGLTSRPYPVSCSS